MKQKLFSLLAFFVFLLFSAQGNRFTYEYRFKVDSTRMDSLKSEFVNLDIFPQKSFYYGQPKFAQDSLNCISVLQQQKAGSENFSISIDTQDWNTQYFIEKTYPDFKINWFGKIEETYVDVEERSNMVWKILPEIQIIENYKCQKATIDFGGRKWIAWFSKDLPFQDGPYKFHGLPGLIVKLEDTKKSHQFILKGSRKLTSSIHSIDYIIGLQKDAHIDHKYVKVTPEQYRKMFLSYKNDPAKDIKMTLSNPNSSIEVSLEGGKIINDRAEVIKYFEEKKGRKYKNNNNYLELSLHQN